jgi:hypothetical protein
MYEIYIYICFVHFLVRLLNKLHVLQWSAITVTRTLDSAIRITISYTVALVSLTYLLHGAEYFLRS